MMATPKREMKPTAAEMLKLVPVRYKRPNAADGQREDIGEDHDHVQNGSERNIKEGAR